eukprot:6187301-Pleurochrysis_carterae.AAC.3
MGSVDRPPPPSSSCAGASASASSAGALASGSCMGALASVSGAGVSAPAFRANISAATPGKSASASASGSCADKDAPPPVWPIDKPSSPLACTIRAILFSMSRLACLNFSGSVVGLQSGRCHLVCVDERPWCV